MNYRWNISIIMCAVALVSFFFIIPTVTVEPFSIHQIIKPNYVSLATSKFAVALFKEINKKSSKENVFISPLSVSAALGIILVGAKGNTANEIEQALYFRKKELNIHPGLGQAISLLNQTTGDSMIRMANKLFIQKDLNVKPFYSISVQSYYKSNIGHVDFKNQESAKTKINNWISKQTFGKITKILDDVDPDTLAMIVNAIYFKGGWAKPFNEMNSSSDTFYLTPRSDINVEMMSVIDDFNFGENVRLKCKILELPYSGNQLSMFIILPDKINGLKRLEKKLSVKMLKNLVKNMRIEHVSVLLPKFQLKEKYSLPEILFNLNIFSLFSENADLSGIFGTSGIYVSSVIHQAAIDVNERGTEAAAVNVISIKPRIYSIPISFKANRPFLFFISHNPTDLILFIGKVYKPNLFSNTDK